MMGTKESKSVTKNSMGQKEKTEPKQRCKWKVKNRAGDELPPITMESYCGIKPESCYYSLAHPVGSRKPIACPGHLVIFFNCISKFLVKMCRDVGPHGRGSSHLYRDPQSGVIWRSLLNSGRYNHIIPRM